MNESTRLDALLSLWQEAAERGESASTEELCRDCPELLEELQQRVEVLRKLGRFARQVHDVETVPVLALPASTLNLPSLPGYDVLGQLGQGGMGVVYEARDRQLDRIVAVKMLRGRSLGDTHRQRFLAEAKAVASLNHPHIVQLFAFGEHEGHPYLVMELVAGCTLLQHCQGRVQSPREAARIVMLLARAVQTAHERGIIHRDLKPANVLLAPPLGDAALDCALGCPKLTDFGLALRTGAAEHSDAGKVAGTPSYMAPEQALGRTDAIGCATDVYALGAILYHLLVARPPFQAPTVTATLHQVTRDDPVPPRLLQPGTPRDLETICLKCLQKDPARRYASAQALADDLRRFFDGEPIHARPIRTPERLWKWARRKPVIATLLAALLLASVAALCGLAYGWRQANQTAALEAGRADYERNQREKVEEQLYLNQIALSSRDLADGRTAWAKATLHRCPARLRQWEWHHLMHRCVTGEDALVRPHAGKVTSVAASADGKWLASADSDGGLHIWDADPRRAQVIGAAGVFGLLGSAAPSAAASLFPGRADLPDRTRQGHLGSVNWIAFSLTGDELYSGGEDGAILAWNPATGQRSDPLRLHEGPISCLAIHPKSSWIASTTFTGTQIGEVLIWDRTTRKILHRLRGHDNRVTGLAFDPAGATLVSASHDRTLILWDARTGARLQTWRDHRFPVACVAFSPDGKMLASAAGRLQSRGPEDSEIIVWDAATGKMRHRLQGHADRAVAVAFTPGARRLATAGWDRHIILWDPTSGQEVLSLTGHTDGVLSLAFTKDGHLLSGGYDRTMRLWPGPGP